ncbi:hypothetical protein AQUCO_00300332v1 [Aquilegia coerulea]|uniref:OTU domain-containing protein n=1 Tax=Aquilegia coerulea TaxID=218851 RepID=A0A2G5EYA1_AQUCA|nr:hypothetical protein AQUCO_00300332v1 [Aquilegia coerulea]
MKKYHVYPTSTATIFQRPWIVKSAILESLKGILSNDGGWRLSVVCGTHNHTLGDNLIGHAYVGRLTLDERLLSTIYNYRAKNRLSTLQGRSQMQQLFKSLDDNGYSEFHMENESDGVCTDIIFAHPQSVSLAKCFPEVLLMDCTYKTNCFNLPLLEIVGFTSTMKTFAIAFGFLQAEKVDNFIWALEKLTEILEGKAEYVGVIVTDRDLALMKAISMVFPKATHLLCRFHIMRNVESKCKKNFKTKKEYEEFMKDFGDLMQSSTENDYEDRLEILKVSMLKRKLFCDMLKINGCQVENQWLSNYKQKFISAWIDSVMHFDTLTTNRVESMHASLKIHLGTSRGNLTQIWKVIDNLLINQLTEINRTFNRSRNSWGHVYKENPYAEIRGLISSDALDLLAGEIKKSNFVGEDQTLCGCVLKKTCGLPCAHELYQMVVLGGHCIPLSSINSRWRKLDSKPVELPIGSLNIVPELEMIKNKFDSQQDDHHKVLMIRKCVELADPKNTYMQEPRKKYDMKEPSGFEYAKTQEEMSESKKKVVAPPKKAPRKLPVKRPIVSSKKIPCKLPMKIPIVSPKKIPCKLPSVKKSRKNYRLKNFPDLKCKWDNDLYELDPRIRDVIDNYENVRGDGHCGYRAIARLLGFNDNDDAGWRMVRGRLLLELEKHELFYMRYLTPERIGELKRNLQCTLTSTMNPDEWFTLPDMGCLVACTFNCVFVCISPTSPCTYFPLMTSPDPQKISLFTVGHVQDGTHFVKLVLANNAPLPPLVPYWEAIRLPKAKTGGHYMNVSWMPGCVVADNKATKYY